MSQSSDLRMSHFGQYQEVHELNLVSFLSQEEVLNRAAKVVDQHSWLLRKLKPKIVDSLIKQSKVDPIRLSEVDRAYFDQNIDFKACSILLQISNKVLDLRMENENA